MNFLRQQEIEIERIKSGIATRAEMKAAKEFPLKSLLPLFETHLKSKGCITQHITATIRHIENFAKQYNIEMLSEIKQDNVEKWIVEQKESNKSPRTINGYILSLKTLLNWCVVTNRLKKNPLTSFKNLNEAIDIRKKRRALTEEEVKRLYDAAEHRKRHIFSGETDCRKRSTFSGKEARLIYMTLVNTGFRSAELASIKVYQINFEKCYIELHAENEKRRKGTRQPISKQFAEILQTWVKDTNKKETDFLFNYTPRQLINSFKCDCKFANIAHKQTDGRSIDIHSLRKTYGTMLARAGVPLTTTQKAYAARDTSINR